MTEENKDRPQNAFGFTEGKTYGQSSDIPCSRNSIGTYTNLYALYKVTQAREPILAEHSKFDNVLMGNPTPTNDPDAAFDYRYYKNSILRFSKYFKRMRELGDREKVYYKTGFYPKRYCEPNRQNLEYSETVTEATVDICDEYKHIALCSGPEFYLYKNGSILLLGADSLNPELFLVRDSFVSAMDMPMGDMLISKGMFPDIFNYTARLVDYEDCIIDGTGTLNIKYETSCGGNLLGIINIDIIITKQKSHDELTRYIGERVIPIEYVEEDTTE